MYRLQLEQKNRAESSGHYQLTHCDLPTFVSIVTGQPVLAAIADQEIQDRGMDPGAWYYTAVWNPDAACWVNDLSEDQAVGVYDQYSRPNYA